MKLSRLFRHISPSIPSALPQILRARRYDTSSLSGSNQKSYLQLFQLKRDHRLMWMQVEGDERMYQTVILHVDSVEPFILIDEPFPVDGVLDGLTGKQITLHFQDGGQQQHMTCQLLGKAGGVGARLYQLSYPERIEKNQRREMYRLPVDNPNHVYLEMKTVLPWLPSGLSTGQEEQRIDTTVLDLSASGMRWMITGNHQLDVHAGKVLTGLGLSILGCGDFAVDLDVSHSEWVPSVEGFIGEQTIIGGRFIGLEKYHIQKLERYITLVQRRKCRGKREQRLLAA